MTNDTFVEYTFICYACDKKVHGIAESRSSMIYDNDCYDCNTPWEKIVVTRKVSNGKKER